MNARHLAITALCVVAAACDPQTASRPSGAGSSGGTSSGGTSSGGTSGGETSSGGTSGGATSSGATSSGATSSGGSGGSGSTVSINAGGPAAGAFLADAYGSGGEVFSTSVAVDSSLIARDPPPASVLQSERYGEFTYAIPDRAPTTDQTVTLYFQESFWTAAGQRTFDVAINGSTVLSAFDILAAAGGANRAIAKSFNTKADANGQVTIRFVRSGADNPKVCGLSVTGEGSTPGGGSSGGTSGGGTSGGGTSGGGTSGDARPSAGCGKPRTLQNGMNSVQSNGTRSYILRVPDDYDPTHPYRLVVAYHWLGGSAPEVANGNSWASERPFYGLWELAAGSTVFVAPVGLVDSMGPGWANVNGQDVAFTDAMLAQLEADLCIDRSRIFANGFSYGAGMSYAIACARPDVFRAVALYSGALISGCAGGDRPIAFFASHGLGDGVLPFARGQELRDHFVAVNGCTNAAPQDTTPGSGSHRCTTYQGCSQGHPVTWCSFDGDHNPNPHDRGATTSWNPGEAWRFLSQF